jgi:hypothetical protein
MKDTLGIAATYKGSLYDSTYIASTKSGQAVLHREQQGGAKKQATPENEQGMSRKWPSNYSSRGIIRINHLLNIAVTSIFADEPEVLNEM